MQIAICNSGLDIIGSVQRRNRRTNTNAATLSILRRNAASHLYVLALSNVIDSRFDLLIISSNIIHYSMRAAVDFIYRSGHAGIQRRSTASRSRVYTQRQACSNYCTLARCLVSNALRISDKCILNLRSNACLDTIIGNCSSQGAAKIAAAIASALFF